MPPQESAVSSVVEHYLDTVGVTGSNPVPRTISTLPGVCGRVARVPFAFRQPGHVGTWGVNFHFATMAGTLCVLAAMIASAPAAPIPAKEEIAAAAAWFDGLAWPDVRGKPYVEVIFGEGRAGAKSVDGPKVRGFLLAEDDKALTVFSDGTVARAGYFSGGGWPFVVQRIPKAPQDAEDESQIAKRIIDLPAAVAVMTARNKRAG